MYFPEVITLYNHLTSHNTSSSLTVNFFHCIDKIVWILEADKSEAFGFVGMLVPDHLCLHKGGKMAECPSQHFISNIVTQVTTEYPKIAYNETEN